MPIKFSCVMDTPARFQHQTLLWALTLLQRGGQPPGNLVVHAVEGASQRQIGLLRDLGIQVDVVRRYSAVHPFLNKLRQLESETLRAADHVVLCDTDLAFCTPIDSWIAGERPRIKIVDVANPPLAMWKMLFNAAGFSAPPRPALTSLDGIETYANNCNGGLAILPRAVFAALPAAWPRWVEWVLRQRNILGRFRTHVFQISFALAMEEMGVAVDLLPLALNFPTNLPVPGLAAHDVDPAVIHYHGNLDAAGRLNTIGLPKVDSAIAATNALMAGQAQSVLMQDYRRRVDQANGMAEHARTQLGRVVRKLRKTARI
jgi:hypothetical protein